MFSSDQLENYAEILVWAMGVSRSRPFEKGDTVLVSYDLPAVRLAEAVYKALLDRRYMVVQRANLTAGMEHSLYTRGAPRQLLFRSPGERPLCKALNGSIRLLAPERLDHLLDADPGNMAMAAKAAKPDRDILEKREQAGDFGWTLCAHPTRSLAEAAGMSLEEYAAQVAKACYLNAPEPVLEWKRVLGEARSVQKWLDGLDADRLHLEGDSLDLWLEVGASRRWLCVTGHNIPSFEVYVSPDWRGTRGFYSADLPSYRSGNTVRNVRLWFEGGRVVRAEADEGERFLAEQIGIDRGSACLGEFSLTDKRLSPIDRFMAMTLYDENHGGRHGNCHLALGASYPGTFDGPPGELTAKLRRELGFNSSALHWDLVNTRPKTVTAHLRSGGKTMIYEDGCFLC